MPELLAEALFQVLVYGLFSLLHSWVKGLGFRVSEA